MEWINALMILIGGGLVRLGIPVLLTVLVVWWLRKLDERWERESERGRARSLASAAGTCNPGCWKIKGCSPERCRSCLAYAHPETPCWQVIRSQNGQFAEKCLSCQVFLDAPVPA